MKNLFTLILLFLICRTITGQINDNAAQKTNELLNGLLTASDMPGLSASVSVDGKIVYSNSFGFCREENKIPCNDSSEFRIGSITKLFTAVALVRLIEQGKIKADERVSEYIDDLPDSYGNITIAQLVSHTAGIRHYTKDEIMSEDTAEYSDLEDGLFKFINDSLLSAPGEKYIYSSYGYVLLGAVMENATGKKFNDIINEYVIIPCGLKNTYPELPGSPVANMSEFYFRSKDGGFIHSAQEYSSYKWPAAGYLSTSNDLALFGTMLAGGEIVSSSMSALLFEPQKTNDGKETGTGFGFRIGSDNKGRKVVHHGGESGGARAFLLIYPAKKLAVALVSNVFRAPLFEGEAETVASYFLNDFDNDEVFFKNALKFSTTYNDKEVNCEFNPVTKTISGFSKQNMPVIDIEKEDGMIRLICTSSSGIINFWLTDENGKYSGKWGYDKAVNELKFE